MDGQGCAMSRRRLCQSLRLGGTFLLTEHRGQLVASGGGHVITERAGIPRREVVNDLSHKLLLLLNPQRLELGKPFCW
jgi:hypothetical protein